MKFASNILILFLISVLLSSCALTGGTVPSVEVCVEIPFTDAPEGACVNTTTYKVRLIDAKTWAIRRKTMVMVDSKDWSKIKLEWKKACRVAGEQCNIQLESVDRMIQGLDNVLEMLLK